MKIKRRVARIAALCAMTAAVATTAVVVEHSAFAAYQDCGDGWFCMWDDMNYGGRIYALQNADSPNVGDYFNDRMTSYWNRTQDIYIAFEQVNYQGTCFWISPGESSAYVGRSLSDIVTSVRRWQPGDEHLFCQG